VHEFLDSLGDQRDVDWTECVDVDPR